MSQCRKVRASLPVARYLLVFAIGFVLLFFSLAASAQDESRRTPPPPPPHPKPKSLKEIVAKVKTWNPFKKHKDDPAATSLPIILQHRQITVKNPSRFRPHPTLSRSPM
jgi:hypothetical protein